jgi:hypothetical protein
MKSKKLDLMFLPAYIFLNTLTIKNSLDDPCLMACKWSNDQHPQFYNGCCLTIEWLRHMALKFPASAKD